MNFASYQNLEPKFFIILKISENILKKLNRWQKWLESTGTHYWRHQKHSNRLNDIFCFNQFSVFFHAKTFSRKNFLWCYLVSSRLNHSLPFSYSTSIVHINTRLINSSLSCISDLRLVYGISVANASINADH